MYSSIRTGNYAILRDEAGNVAMIKNLENNKMYKPVNDRSAVIQTDDGQLVINNNKIVIQDKNGNTVINGNTIVSQSSNTNFLNDDLDTDDIKTINSSFDSLYDPLKPKNSNEFLARNAFDLEFENDYVTYLDRETAEKEIEEAKKKEATAKHTTKKVKKEKAEETIDFKGHKLPKPNWYIEDLHMPIFETKDAIYCNGFVLKNGKWIKTPKAFFVTLFKGGFKY